MSAAEFIRLNRELIDETEGAAQDYHRTNSQIFASRPYLESIREDLKYFTAGLTKDTKILDFGCGTGLISVLLEDEGFTNLHGVEYSGPVIDGAAQILNTVYPQIWEQTEPIRQSAFQFYDGFPLPFDVGSFDAVLLYAVLEHIIPDLVDEVLREIKRVLSPKGSLYIGKLPRKLSVQENLAKALGMSAHEQLYSQMQARKVLSRNGYSIQKLDKTDLLFQHPDRLVNKFFGSPKYIEKLVHVPLLNTFAHNYRIIACHARN